MLAGDRPSHDLDGGIFRRCQNLRKDDVCRVQQDVYCGRGVQRYPQRVGTVADHRDKERIFPGFQSKGVKPFGIGDGAARRS